MSAGLLSRRLSPAGCDQLRRGAEQRIVDKWPTATRLAALELPTIGEEFSMKPFEFEKVSVEEARWALEGEPAKPGVSNSTDKRTRTVEESLLNDTRTWLGSLPKDVRPVELVRQFPRIANRLRHLWKQVARCEEYLDDLLVDRRGTRKGFPSKISEELEALREYYALLYPRDRTTWDQVE